MVNPGAEVMKKLNKSKFLETIGEEWIFLTVGEAVGACNYMLHSCTQQMKSHESDKQYNNV